MSDDLGMSKTKPKRIFSGDYSVDMWCEINDARTIAELRRALHFVCCRLQELEAEVFPWPKRKARR